MASHRLEPTSNGRGEAASVVASAPPHLAADALDVGEQIRRLQTLAELRGAGILTDGELTDLKQRVLSPLAPAADGGEHGVGTGSEAVLDRREPKGSYVTTLEVVGAIPIVCRVGGNNRPSYARWRGVLDAAAAEAAARARPTSSALFSLRIELRLYAPSGQGSDLDNYVKPVQDALAARGIFGPAANAGSTMKGDEHIDHLDVRRRRVSSEAEAGVLAEVWALDG